MVKILVRNVIGIGYSIAYGSLVFGIVVLGYSAVFSNLPPIVSLVAVAIVSGLASFYVAMIGYTNLSFPSLLAGVIGGLITWQNFHAVSLPSHIVVALGAATIVAGIAASIFPKSKPRTSYISTFFIIQTLELLLTVTGAVLSVWVIWFRPLLIVIAAIGLLMWRPFLIGACPLTLYQTMLRKRANSPTAKEFEDSGFNVYLINKIFGTHFSHSAFMKAMYVGAVITLLAWLSRAVIKI